MPPENSLNAEMSKKISFFGLKGLKLWVWVCLVVGVFIVMILCILSLWITFRRKSRSSSNKFPFNQIPHESKDIRVDRARFQNHNPHPESLYIEMNDKSNGKTMLSHLGRTKSSDNDTLSQCSSVNHHGRACSSHSGEEGGFGSAGRQYGGPVTASPLVGLPEISHLGWGHWFTLRDLELATNRFAAVNVLGEGGYGVVYRGKLVNGTEVAVKKLLNNLGQAEKEFRVEVEAIGHVRHKNLVRLLGYCIEGVHRMLVYEYVNSGNLEQWLHGAMRQHGNLTWEARMKIITGTAQALAYLHEAIEPKVAHRDIKASNILIDDEFNAKLSDFGLAKLLDSGESHITTRVMGTFGYVAPEYANTGMLNEKSDIYSFGVLLLEAVTGRDPVDYGRPANEVNLVEWLKMMVGTRRAEEVVDPRLEPRPSKSALKRALLVSLRCVDPEAEKRPRMSQVARMLESDEHPFHKERRNRRSKTATMEIVETKDESLGPSSSDTHITKAEKTCE
ncbi:PREDICTED: probable receptor-like protein kinase At2g42960 [Camelina sativa]|uniref:non-specific serine/threonine protein kinase n=1 Tax=Camelina sativa TaxID=90675 RepID=A0ABM0ZMI7_CAMSA|nr:PREDICTED: probable receptor-like protein kinase At2g42960 [Camelina sativa]XP_010517848.1 PREDICTED: probable receptor-like protein kinase At2g42960 [Camelina sativa]